MANAKMCSRLHATQMGECSKKTLLLNFEKTWLQCISIQEYAVTWMDVTLPNNWEDTLQEAWRSNAYQIQWLVLSRCPFRRPCWYPHRCTCLHHSFLCWKSLVSLLESKKIKEINVKYTFYTSKFCPCQIIWQHKSSIFPPHWLQTHEYPANCAQWQTFPEAKALSCVPRH